MRDVLIEPDGRVRPLAPPDTTGDPCAYGRRQPGPRRAEAVRSAARQDRRGCRREPDDRRRGWLLDITS